MNANKPASPTGLESVYLIPPCAVMNPEARRIACDRCRGQKLRCVRSYRPGVLSACERCLKAGAECTNSLSDAQRKMLEARQPQSLRLPPSSSATTFLDPRSVVPEVDTSPVYESIPSVPAKRKVTQPLVQQAQYLSAVHPAADYSSRHISHYRQPPSDPARTVAGPNPDASKPTTMDFGVESLVDFELNDQGNGHFMDTCMLFDDPKGITTPSGPSVAPSSKAGSTSASQEAIQNDTTSSPAVPLGSREDCLHCLSELSSQILRDSNKMRGMPLPDILSFSAWPDKRKGQTQPGLQNSIGRLFDLTQAFVNILQCLQLTITISTEPPSLTSATAPASAASSLPVQPRSPHTPSNDSDCSYSEYWEEPMHHNPSGRAGSTTNSISLLGSLPDAPVPEAGGPASVHVSTAAATNVDMPTTLTILTCYIWLLHAYGTIFHRIHAACHAELPASLSPCSVFSSLSSSSSSSSTTSSSSSSAPQQTQRSATTSSSPNSSSGPGPSSQLVPSVLPGLQIGGFDLHSHRDFQLEIILHLSAKMLGRIEKLLGISLVSSPAPNAAPEERFRTGDTGRTGPGSNEGGKTGDRGILDTASATALLEVMVKQNDQGYMKEVNGGAASVKQTLDDIRKILQRVP
ncbi:Zn(II)2Cys6 transcription factor domain-containing protein [Aspergillus saccharolyticus JOP 1030-1]|uniref:Zn(2)-C6 fungal-type domain-containing protein n=1 Tax=Aspergillus saccharolyticus JOP 1030-1 TaxID=1450539 RepID=A0A318Z544_9EURO|nr:hypothetical protein BP01DRAFT_135503 [Aspergillus saccharolyticus JOP 1030-1]PYH42435.1 hypothetical protein BP01DRAFT_135503 [Aspergillus saccharolyticus JOP 1030-1]